MNSFPWDSIVEYMDDGYPVYDRAYSAQDWRNIYKTFFSNGIFADSANAFKVKASGQGMSVIVSPGRCSIEGVFGVEDSQRQIELTASSTQARYDTIVLRFDASLESRSVDLYVLQGVASNTPKRPTLTRNETVYELGLCDILIPANSSAVADSRITDTRLETERCGIVNPFSTVDTTTFFSQIQAAVDEAVAAMNAALDETIVGNLEVQINDRVAKKGDTMTGDLEIRKGDNDDVSFKYTNGENYFRTHTFKSTSRNCQAFGITNNNTSTNDFVVYSDTGEVGLSQALPIGSGGTGGKTTKAAQNRLLGDMAEVSDEPTDGSYVVCAYGANTDSIGAVYKRKFSNLVNWLNSKMASFFVKKTGDTMTGDLQVKKKDASVRLENDLGSAFRIHTYGSEAGKGAFGVYDVNNAKHPFWISEETGNVNLGNALPIGSGGTGLKSAPSLAVNLASESAGGIFSAEPRPGVTGTLQVNHGGTGGTTASAARGNLGLNSIYQVKSYSTSALSLSGATNKTATIATTTPTGYGVAGIVGFSSNHSGSLAVTKAYMSGTTVNLECRALTSTFTASDLVITVNVLYIKSLS